MSCLVKYKNQTEYSFYRWIWNYPESFHPSDTQRFHTFARTVCSFGAKKWMSTAYLEKRILVEKPNFQKDVLQNLLCTYEHLISFHKTCPMPRSWIYESGDASRNCYLERGMKNGKFYEIEKSIDTYPD